MTRFHPPGRSLFLAVLGTLAGASLAVPGALSSLPLAAAPPPGEAAVSSYCVTPTVTCTAVQPGPPGAPCSCKTPDGWVQGVLK